MQRNLDGSRFQIVVVNETADCLILLRFRVFLRDVAGIARAAIVFVCVHRLVARDSLGYSHCARFNAPEPK